MRGSLAGALLVEKEFDMRYGCTAISRTRKGLLLRGADEVGNR